MTGTGTVNDPNCMTSTRYMTPIPMKRAVNISLNTSSWSREAPPRVRPYPSGNSMLRASLMASAVTSPDDRPSTFAETVTVRLPSRC
jgi:hypothetical protein